MAMRFRSGTFEMCMDMAPPERRECVLKSSGANPSLFDPTRLHSALRTVMIIEALTDWIPLGVG